MLKEKRTKLNIHFSSLITQARMKKGYATLRELYRDHKPIIDYQTWLAAESGRRVPTASAVIEIGDILEIDREPLILAYCKDKFIDDRSQTTLKALDGKDMLSMDAFVAASDHDRCDDFTYTARQLAAMKKDPRLRLYLTYTYDEDSKTTISRLVQFFAADVGDVRAIIEQLKEMTLVEVIGDEIKKIHPHSSLPKTKELFDLRKQLLLKSLEITVRPDSYLSNFHCTIPEESYKKILAYLDFINAHLVKMAKENKNNPNSISIQIAMTGNRLSEGYECGDKKC